MESGMVMVDNLPPDEMMPLDMGVPPEVMYWSAFAVALCILVWLADCTLRAARARRSTRSRWDESQVSLNRVLSQAQAVDVRAVTLWFEYENNLDFVLKFPEAFRVDSELNQRAQDALTSLAQSREQVDTVKQVCSYLAEAKDAGATLQAVLKETRALAHSLLTPGQTPTLRKLLTSREPDKKLNAAPHH